MTNQTKELEALRAFALDVLNVSLATDVQHVAIKHGLLQGEFNSKPCGSNCSCLNAYGPLKLANGIVCYRKTAILLGKEKT